MGVLYRHIRLDTNEPFYIGISNWAKNQKGEKHRKSKKIIDESTGIIYSCLREASEKTGINYSTLRSNLNGRRPNNTTFKLL